MESQRSFLVLGLIFVSFLLWQKWHEDYGPQPVVENNTSTQQVDPSSNELPQADDVPASTAVPGSTPVTNEAGITSQLISVTTDTLNVVIDTKGGDVVSASLNLYPTQVENGTPKVILDNIDSVYEAQSGLIGKNGPDGSPEGRPIYSSAQSEYQLTGDELLVPLTYQVDNIFYTKTFRFIRGSHSIEVEYDIVNQSDSVAIVQQFAQLKQTTAATGGTMFMPTYRGAAYSTQESRYEKFKFDDFYDERVNVKTPGGWVAMLEHYFVSAWVPPQDQNNTITSRLQNQQFAIIGYTSEPVTIAPGASANLASTLYIGPKIQSTLKEIARGLDLTVDYGFLFWLAQPLFKLLDFIQDWVVNWGAAIIIITIIVKGLMYPLTKAQYISMGKMRALQPKMQALKDRYGDDRQKMSQGMMELYKKEKVNPMGGCFPLLLQMPIFLALYWVLLESVELRHADFVFWITDLSVKDPYFVLPILTGASMYLLQKLNPTTIQDPMQQKIMQWMPVFMSVFFLWFPAGLVLYWLISNVITIVQAKIIYNAMEKKGMKVN